MEGYMLDDSLYAEQFNTLLLVDKIIADKKLSYKPVFYLVGGTAILLHGITSVFTVDIDCANRMTEQVRELTQDLLNDMASDVIVLPKLYETRLKVFKGDTFEHCSICLVSLPDIIISKCVSWRTKDKEDLITTDILDKCDFLTLKAIAEKEIPVDVRPKVLERLVYVYDERSEFKFKE